MAIRYNDVRVSGAAGTRSFTTSIGGAPSAGDVVVAQIGEDRYDAGLDLTAIDLLGVTFGENRRAGIGDLGTPLKVVVNQTGAGILKNFAGASNALFVVESSSSTGVIETIWNAPVGQNTLSLDNADSALWLQQRGRGISKAGHDLAALYVTGGMMYAYASAFAMTIAAVRAGGYLEMARDTATLEVDGGGNCDLVSTTVSPATASRVAGTLRVYESGTHTAMRLCAGGVLDLTQERKPFTITTLVSEPGSLILIPKGRKLTDLVTIGTDTLVGVGYDVRAA